ncbi:response regulator transcription factor [Fulvivirgaceae bacterium BMA10]|uniref:Response regulator transcription factor n=1 Tax=Splendidivirga corallicola TaxID=3051826 RepID=A0ABT8KSV2_9BACT|nr:response regulator transcription factor [Fulvivirgaceae bacterium BMA10]
MRRTLVAELVNIVGKMINIALIDDHKLIRSGIKKLLSTYEDLNVIDEYGNYNEALENFNNKVDVWLIDISLGDGNGIDLLKKWRNRRKDIRVIFLSVHKESYYVIKALETGANGYLYKDVSVEEIITAIKRVYQGKNYYSNEISEILINNLHNDSKWNLPKLTSRETEILNFIVGGFSTKEIANELSVSPRTVDSHRTNILDKFGFKNTTQMVRVLTKENFI